MLQSLNRVGDTNPEPKQFASSLPPCSAFKGSCKTAAISLASHADSNLCRPPRRHQRVRIWGRKLQEPTPVRPREVVLAPREEGGASGRERGATPTRRWPRALRGSERGPGPRVGPLSRRSPRVPGSCPPGPVLITLDARLSQPCSVVCRCRLGSLVRSSGPFLVPTLYPGSHDRGIPEGASSCRGWAQGGPPSDHAVGGRTL